MIKNILLNIIGFFVTIIITPLLFSLITYYLVFPSMTMSFIQLLWISECIWLCLNYITINIENAIKNKNK